MQHDAASWPPAYGLASSMHPMLAAGPGGGLSLPTREQLDYVKALITALLLILALPWLATKLLTNPAAVLRGTGHPTAS